MALWKGFSECWKDFADRMDHGARLLDYLKTHGECLKPETTKHLLSIGPGTAEIDHGLVHLLPHLTSYTAVEPDTSIMANVKERMEEFTSIKKHYINGLMETYTGPPHGVDIILISHSGYYFADSFSKQIACALSWLNRGGRILVVHGQDTVNRVIASGFDVHSDKYDLMLVDDVRRHLVDMGVSFTESGIDHILDVSYPGPTYYGFVSVIVNWRATKEEVDKALALLSQVFIPGTKKVLSTQSLFVIEKKTSGQNDN